MEEDIENMSATISSLRARYFIIGEGDEDDPDTWRADEEAARCRYTLRAETDAKNKKKAEIVEEMVSGLAKRPKGGQSRRSLLELPYQARERRARHFR
jgi:hypothetical protein